MTSNAREGDFDSILEDDTLEDATQNLDDVLSQSGSMIEGVEDVRGVQEHVRGKCGVCRGGRY